MRKPPWYAPWRDPRPDPGEGICIRCALHDGQTLIMRHYMARDHLATHVRHQPEGEVRIVARSRGNGAQAIYDTWTGNRAGADSEE